MKIFGDTVARNPRAGYARSHHTLRAGRFGGVVVFSRAAIIHPRSHTRLVFLS